MKEQQILGDYRILKQIGHGSLGKVLLAEHRFIKKTYVLKVLPEELSSDRGFVQRFEEEVNGIATLEHPHIVKIHNVSFAEGAYFLVSDCIVDSIGETTNLAQYMSGRKERLREEELLRLLSQIASALDYAHSKEKLCHLSLKLNNILVGKGKPGIEVYLSDFGLSKVIGAGAVISRCFKAMAEALGVEFSMDEKYTPTPVETHKLSKLNLSFLQAYAFLAPEQKRLEDVGIAADIYAFGVLTYYLITGLFPEGVMDISSHTPIEYKCDWNRLISQCMSPSPEKRPQMLTPILEVLSKGSASLPETFTTPPLKAVAPPDPEPAPLPKPPITVEVEERVLEPVLMQVSEPVSAEPTSPMSITPSTDEKYERALSSMLHREPVVTQYQPEQREKRTIEPIQSEMGVIQAGHFMRGSNDGNRDETPQHQIYLDSYAIDVHAVTNEQFSRFLEHMGCEKDQNYNDLIRLKDSRINRITGKLSIESGYAKHPVVGVTWYGAVGYASWVGKRLPTEAEWEIAARGGQENAPYPTGDSIEKNQANIFSVDTTAAKSYAPNAYGLYDLIGNVYEWCQDWYGYNYYETSAQEPDKPKGPIQGVYRVLRGGCWKSLREDMRCSHRHRNNPGTVNGTYGFRCASDAS